MSSSYFGKLRRRGEKLVETMITQTLISKGLNKSSEIPTVPTIRCLSSLTNMLDQIWFYIVNQLFYFSKSPILTNLRSIKPAEITSDKIEVKEMAKSDSYLDSGFNKHQ